MPTQKEIADQLGISTATVSRVLNGRPGVTLDVRERVLKLTHEMQAAASPPTRDPNPSVHSAIAFVVFRYPPGPDALENFYALVMQGAEQELGRYGYHVVAATVGEEVTIDPVKLPWLAHNRVDGMILCMPEVSGRLISLLTASGLPAVLVSDIRSHAWLDSVTSDDREGGFHATKHLLEHGHKHIAFLSGPEEWSVVGNRVQGYREAMREAGFEERLVVGNSANPGTGRACMNQVLAIWPDTTAVFAMNDPVAIGASQVAREAGRRLPDDLAIIGYDDMGYSSFANPPLTTVRVHKDLLGILAARRLMEILQHGRDIPVHIQVGNELVIRASCGCQGSEPIKGSVKIEG